MSHTTARGKISHPGDLSISGNSRAGGLGGGRL